MKDDHKECENHTMFHYKLLQKIKFVAKISYPFETALFTLVEQSSQTAPILSPTKTNSYFFPPKRSLHIQNVLIQKRKILIQNDTSTKLSQFGIQIN